jgi:hypothetical protein
MNVGYERTDALSEQQSRVYTMQVCSRERSPGDGRADVSCKIRKLDRLNFEATSSYDFH